MASGQQDVVIRKNAKEFTYEAGMWEAPATDDQPEKLLYGNTILATADLGTSNLGNTGSAEVTFMLSKPAEGETCYGWQNSNLQFKAVLGDKSAIFNGLGKMYYDMPAGKVSTFGIPLDLSGNTDPLNIKLQFTLSDDDTTSKAGLYFHWAQIDVK